MKDIKAELELLRSKLDLAFCKETKNNPDNDITPSAGHCAAVSIIINKKYGGDMVSCIINGESHWFNRIMVGEELKDIDLTGDQFGYPAVQIEVAGELYKGSRVRRWEELTEGTIKRSELLSSRVENIG
jgi:hypothetical protein